MMKNQTKKMARAMITLAPKIRSRAPRSWRWPAARRTSFQAWSTRLASAIVRNSEARQPSMIVEMPAVTKPVRYCTWEPAHSQNSGWGPNRLRHSSNSTASNASARAPSDLRRRSPARTGEPRKHTGAVHERLPMNSPRESLGSLLGTLARLARPGVDRVDRARVLLVHDVALDLQRRRELAGFLREVLRQDLEALDLLHRTDLRVYLVDHLLHLRAHLLTLRSPLGLELLRVERDQGHEVGAAVAYDHGLGDPAALLEAVLEVGGGDVLAARGDDDVLLAAGDEQEAVLVEAAQVARVQPLALERLVRGLVVLVVALEDVGTLDQHFAVVGDPDLDAGQRLAHRAEAEVVGAVDRGGGCRLRHAVALHHRHSAGVEELEDLRGNRRRARHAFADVLPEQGTHVLVERLLGPVERLLQLRGHLLSALPHLPDLHAHLHGLPQLLLVGRVAGGERVDLLEHPRHRREVARVDLGQVRDDLGGVARPVGQSHAQVEGGELDQDREGVGKWQEEVAGVPLLQWRLPGHSVCDRTVVAVGEQAALRRACGARRVDVEAHVVAGDCPVALLPLGLRAAPAALAEGVQAEGVASQLGARRVDHDHVAQLGTAGADRADLLQLLPVLREDRTRVGVLEHVLALGGRVGLVDRDQHASGREDAEAGLAPLRPGVGQDRDLVAGLETQVDQPERDLAHDRAELRV